MRAAKPARLRALDIEVGLGVELGQLGGDLGGPGDGCVDSVDDLVEVAPLDRRRRPC